MGHAKANRQKTLIHATLGIDGRPARHVLKQTDGSNAAIGAEVEPMPGAPRHTNQIAGFHFDGDNRSGLGVNMKESMACDYEAYLVFVMPVFTTKLPEHRFEPRRLGTNIDYISRYITASGF
jgi:hypothetical protein